MAIEPGTLAKGRYVTVEGEVYCLYHGCVHVDTLDPYSEGRPTCFDGEYGERTKPMVHRRVAYFAKRGDYPPEEA